MRPDAKPEGLRQAMSWLHTYAGLLLGWLLFAMFLTGTLSYVQDEITTWMQPETHRSYADTQTAQRAVDTMRRLAPDAQTWTMELPGARTPAVNVSWRPADAPPGRGHLKRATIDAGTGQVIDVRDTRGGAFLYAFHFQLYGLPLAAARWITGTAAFFMLVAIISGVITHKKIFTDFFTFRPRKGQRSWLDAHNAMAVLGLPFHFALTFSGLLLLMFTLLPWGIGAAYDGQASTYFAERRAIVNPPPIPRAAPPATAHDPADIAGLVRDAQARWQGMPVGTVVFTRPGRADGIIELRPAGGNSVVERAGNRQYYAMDGTPLQSPPRAALPFSTAAYNAMINVHIGRFAGPALRWIFFLSGIAGTLMAATGLVLWVVKRLPERHKRGGTPFSHRLVEVLNVGAIAGLTVAIASYFWLNRLLPAALAQRADWEIRGFFIAWLLCLLHPIVRGHRQAWIEQLTLAVLLLALLPALNAATGGLPLWESAATGQWSVAGFEFSVWGVAALLGFAVIKLRAHPVAPAHAPHARGPGPERMARSIKARQ